MKAISFYLLYPLIYLVSRAPFWMLYGVSNGLYFIIYKLLGYRKSVVRSNLVKAFPEKSIVEIKGIEKRFYSYLCDLVMETLKTTSWGEKEVKSRLSMEIPDWMTSFYNEKRSFVIVMGHFGNWEWAGPCFSLNCSHQLVVVYLPLTNPYFDKMLVRARTKFGTQIIRRSTAIKEMVKARHSVNATALIADQAPIPIENAEWIQFLNQDTAVFLGPEKISKKLDQPVVYMRVDRTSRGKYHITPVLITDNPKETSEMEITNQFNRLLEDDIRRNPEIWLWSHKRWKHQRQKPVENV